MEYYLGKTINNRTHESMIVCSGMDCDDEVNDSGPFCDVIGVDLECVIE